MKPEPSKWLPIALSTIAIGISCFSWWESHRGRVINEEINRPILILSEVLVEKMKMQETPGREVQPDDPRRVGIVLTAKIKNIGRSTASVQYFDFRPRRNVSETCQITEDIAVNWAGPKGMREILAGSEETIAQPFFLAEGCEKAPVLEFGVLVPIAYTDSGSGNQYFQELRRALRFDMTK